MSKAMLKVGEEVNLKCVVKEVDYDDDTYQVNFGDDQHKWLPFDIVEGSCPGIRELRIREQIEKLNKELEELTNEK